MIHRLLNHARHNVVGYIAIMIAVVSGGGGYAIAATAHQTTTKHKKKPTTVAACASNRTGEMYLHRSGRCPRGRHKVTWAIKGPKGTTGATGAAGATGPQGPAGPSAAAFGTIGPNAPVALSGMTARNEGNGAWIVSLLNPACANTRNVITVTPSADYDPSAPRPPDNATPVAWASSSFGSEFNVNVGYVANGSFTAINELFQVIAECGATLLPGQ